MASMIPRRMTINNIYNEFGHMCIRYDGKIEDRANGQKEIAGTRPTYSNMHKQVEYKFGSGTFYSLLMGPGFKPDQYAILLDIGNTVECDATSGLHFSDELDMDQYDAPKQHTPSSGLHYIFNVDGEQAKRIGSKTCITHNGIKYSMDVKFKNGLCNCQPRKYPNMVLLNGSHLN